LPEVKVQGTFSTVSDQHSVLLQIM